MNKDLDLSHTLEVFMQTEAARLKMSLDEYKQVTCVGRNIQTELVVNGNGHQLNPDLEETHYSL